MAQQSSGSTLVWAKDDPPGLAQNQVPITVKLILGAQPQRQRQYPLGQKVKIGIQEHLAKLTEAGLLISASRPEIPHSCQLRNQEGDINQSKTCGPSTSVAVSLYLVVPNPCTLLQYVDDLLLASDTQDCTKGTKALLQLLSNLEY